MRAHFLGLRMSASPVVPAPPGKSVTDSSGGLWRRRSHRETRLDPCLQADPRPRFETRASGVIGVQLQGPSSGLQELNKRVKIGGRTATIRSQNGKSRGMPAERALPA